MGTNIQFNCIMKLYSNAYDYAIYSLQRVLWVLWGWIFQWILVFLQTLSTKKNIWLLCVYPNYYIFKGKSFEMHFLREQFWCAPVFWNAFFEGTILKSTYVLKYILWGRNYFGVYGCWLVWLLLSAFKVAN